MPMPAAGAAVRTCRTHPRERAGWECSACGAALCPACAAEEQVAHSVRLPVCGLCGGSAQVLRVHRSAVPYAARLPQALLYLFNANGAIGLLASGAVLGLLWWVFWISGPMMLVLGVMVAGVFWASFFHIVTSTRMGRDQLDVPEFGDLWGDVVGPALRALAAMGWLLGPALLWLWLGRGWSLERPWADPALWVAALAGVAYLPMALIVAAAGGGLFQVLDPRIALVGMRRMGRDYVVCVAVVFGLSLLAIPVELVALLIKQLPIPFVARVLGEAVGLALPFTIARAIGLLLYVRGDALELGTPDEYFDLALPGAAPRGVLPAQRGAMAPGASADASPISEGAGGAGKYVPADWTGDEPPRPAPAPIELEPEPASPAPPPQTARASRFASIAPPAALDPATLPRPPSEEIAAALTAGDLARAISRYAAAADEELSLPAQAHLSVGQGAAQHGELELAVRALKQAATLAPDDPIAPKACVLLARVYGEKLGDPASAERLFRHVVDRYPGTPAAQFARARLQA